MINLPPSCIYLCHFASSLTSLIIHFSLDLLCDPNGERLKHHRLPAPRKKTNKNTIRRKTNGKQIEIQESVDSWAKNRLKRDYNTRHFS